MADTPNRPKETEESLDPQDWAAFRLRAHEMLDAAIDKMETTREGRVWSPVPDEMKAALGEPLSGGGEGAAVDADLKALLRHGVGNTHPRFFGWVHGSGTPSNVIAGIMVAAMNANTGGRDHAAIYVERQVVDWCRDLFGFPKGTSGLVVSGTSMATLIALKVARDKAVKGNAREEGVQAGNLIAYTSEQSHSCVSRALDILGLGSDCLRLIPVNSAYEMDVAALREAIECDWEAGLAPFAIIGSVGTVNTGAIDDIDALADIAEAQKVWLHVDGAFGACAMLSAEHKSRLKGIERADSLAFDFHKWMHVNYDAGCVLIRDGTAHLEAFASRPAYLSRTEKGLAAGSPWPVDYGPELSRGFRALKVWAHLKEHGPDKIGRLVARNCQQAEYLGQCVETHPDLELLAPISLQICCFRYVGRGDLDALNAAIVVELQERGIAAPSTTWLDGKLAIRVNITNHRTRIDDLDKLVDAVVDIGREIQKSRLTLSGDEG